MATQRQSDRLARLIAIQTALEDSSKMTGPIELEIRQRGWKYDTAGDKVKLLSWLESEIVKLEQVIAASATTSAGSRNTVRLRKC